MNTEELRCPCCGARLTLETRRDGQSEEAENYSAYTPDWDVLVLLACTCCTAEYPVARTPNAAAVSRIRVMQNA